jgi:hypothetical protein
MVLPASLIDILGDMLFFQLFLIVVVPQDSSLTIQRSDYPKLFSFPLFSWLAYQFYALDSKKDWAGTISLLACGLSELLSKINLRWITSSWVTYWMPVLSGYCLLASVIFLALRLTARLIIVPIIKKRYQEAEKYKLNGQLVNTKLMNFLQGVSQAADHQSQLQSGNSGSVQSSQNSFKNFKDSFEFLKTRIEHNGLPLSACTLQQAIAVNAQAKAAMKNIQDKICVDDLGLCENPDDYAGRFQTLTAALNTLFRATTREGANGALGTLRATCNSH